MYPNEFPPEPPPPVVDPTLLALLVLLVVALVAFALWLGRQLEARGQARRSEAAADGIWKAISRAADAANDARGEDLIGKAGALREEIDRRLGPVWSFGRGFVDEVRALRDALEGEGREADPAREGHAAERHEAEAGGSTISIHQPRKVVIRGGEPAAKGEPERPVGDGDRRVSLRDVRAAVTAFREWWGDRRERVRELREAQAALNRAPLSKRAAGG